MQILRGYEVARSNDFTPSLEQPFMVLDHLINVYVSMSMSASMTSDVIARTVFGFDPNSKHASARHRGFAQPRAAASSLRPTQTANAYTKEMARISSQLLVKYM